MFVPPVGAELLALFAPFIRGVGAPFAFAVPFKTVPDEFVICDRLPAVPPA
jgi:hypothetical protein